MSRLVVAALCALTGTAFGFSIQQTTPPAPSVFRAGVDIIPVEVTALDKDRRPVPGLTAAEFTVLEDGKVRPIVAFAPVHLPGAVFSSTPWLRDVAPDVVTNVVPREGRLIVIMLDRSVGFDDVVLARRIADEVVNQLGPNDLASVAFTSEFGNVGTPQNFTADKARLRTAIERRFTPTTRGKTDEPEQGGCPCGLCVMDSISKVAQIVRDVPGRRKLMFFISTQFTGAAGGVSRRNNAFPCDFPLKLAREKLIRETGLANLTIHTLNPKGVGQVNTGHMLADLTGGRAVSNTNAPEEHVHAIFEESASYYVLGFRSADPSPNSRVHKIEVKTSRRGITVRGRNGYVTPPSASKMASTRADAGGTILTRALDGVLPSSDVPLGIRAAPFAQVGQKDAMVAIVVGLRPTFPEPASTGLRVRVLTAAFDARGGGVGRPEEQVVTLSADSAPTGSTECELLARLSLPPGRYEIRTAVEEVPGNRTGTVFTFVDVPEFAKSLLSLSGVALAASPALTSAPAAAFADLLPVVPTARREFGRADQVTSLVRVYQGGNATLAPVEIRAQIIDGNNLSVFTVNTPISADRFTANRTADYHLDLPLTRLELGEYLLTIRAALASFSSERQVRFKVR